MFKTIKKIQKFIFGLLVFSMVLTACANVKTPAETETPVLVSSLTPTPNQPTSTPIPAAAVVNGERIPLAWLESEVARYLLAQEALGQPLPDETIARQIVLDDLIAQVLLAQGAREAGVNFDEETVQGRIDALAAEVDINAWMIDWGYSEEDLFQLLNLQLLGAFQRDQIANAVPEEVEQVELQQVLTYTEAGAKDALLSLNSGKPFDEVALIYQPVTGGYMGWVPQGYLLIPDVEEEAFNLPVDQYSEIIESDIGYHIVMVLDREVRPLNTDARLTLQRQAVQSWLAEQIESSMIEVLID